MRPSEGAGSIDVPVRAFSYDFGASGPALTRAVAVEAPVQIVIGGAPFAVMMATPSDLEDFATGFVLTEQIAASVADIRGVEVEPVEDGWKLKIALSSDRLRAHLARGRAMSGRTGCGLCGIEDFSQIPSPSPPLHPQAPIAPEAIRAGLAELEGRQPLNQATRAVHAAAWCGRDGQRFFCHHQPLFVRDGREGRHLWRGNPGVGLGPDLACARAGPAFRRSRDRCRAPRPGFVLRRRERRSERGIGGVTTGKIDRLVRMANQIGEYHASMPEREATEGAASHLRLYWTPKMIREIIAFADQGHPGLNAVAARAVQSLKETATPA
jgi:FdhD/NarQ family/NADH-dependant formate dehydrogenase delta subunit FdsD